MSTAVHGALALVLTLVLVAQAGALAGVLRSRRVLASRHPPRKTELVWIVIPVVVVLFLAARSWIVVLDPGSPAVAAVASVNVSTRPARRGRRKADASGN